MSRCTPSDRSAFGLNRRGRARRLASHRLSSRLLSPLRTARTDDGRHPFVQIITLRSRAAIRRRFQRNLRQLLLDASRAARQRTLLLAHDVSRSLLARAVAFFGSTVRACLCASIDRSFVDLSIFRSSRRVASHTHVRQRTRRVEMPDDSLKSRQSSSRLNDRPTETRRRHENDNRPTSRREGSGTSRGLNPPEGLGVDDELSIV